MKIGFIVNSVETEKSGYTTTRLAMASVNRGHEVFYIGTGDLTYNQTEQLTAQAVQAPTRKYKSSSVFFEDLLEKISERQLIDIGSLDVLMLRNDPSVDKGRAWAQTAGIFFGRIAKTRGVIVLNDPDGLSRAMNKLYLQQFPEEVRPRTLITRSKREIRQFFEEQNQTIVLKPLQGSGGENVFLVRPESANNLNQMIDAIARDGYIVAQEYLPLATEGDVRLFVMNGLPLKSKGKYAAFKRIRSEQDMRSNVHAGGSIARIDVNASMLRLAEIVRPKLVEDGIFLAGLDIVGDKLMEINVFSPGGLGSAQKVQGPNFTLTVMEALERKVSYVTFYKRNFNNVDLAIL